jgi:hypothetical protein
MDLPVEQDKTAVRAGNSWGLGFFPSACDIFSDF